MAALIGWYIYILLTGDLQGNGVLLVIDAHHHLTAVQTGVART